jgi:L-alanine-DL-glutamate epimerase-like enolase superfamily enzyme
VKISSVELKPYQLRHKEGFSSALGHVEVAPVVFILVHTDEGMTGIGYAPGSAPFYCGETQESIMAAIAQFMAPVVKGRDPFDIAQMMIDIDKSLRLNLRAKAGLEIALYDLLGKILNIPLFKFWGGLCKENIPIMRMVGIASPDIMAQKAQELVNQGFRHLKVKLGKDPKSDIDRIKAIRETMEDPDVSICVDANQGYTVKEAIATIRAIEKYDVKLVEQPVRADDLEGLATVRKAVGIPIEVDESVRSLSDVLNVIKLGAADFISLKPLEMGGFRRVHKILALCEAANLKCLVGTTPGSSFIDSANAHFIASSPYLDFPCEIGESLRMQNDPVTGLKIQNGSAMIPEGPGLGIHLSLEELEM